MFLVVKVDVEISCDYFSFLDFQRSAQVLYETLNSLVAALVTFTARKS